jgi:hypothetical protein
MKIEVNIGTHTTTEIRGNHPEKSWGREKVQRFPDRKKCSQEDLTGGVAADCFRSFRRWGDKPLGLRPGSSPRMLVPLVTQKLLTWGFESLPTNIWEEQVFDSREEGRVEWTLL